MLIISGYSFKNVAYLQHYLNLFKKKGQLGVFSSKNDIFPNGYY